MKRLSFFSTIIISIAWIFFSTACNATQAKSKQTESQRSPKEIKLVVSVVVDMLRADMLTNHRSQLSEKGFKYLMNHGVWFRNARYDYCTTLTAVNHASIYTGTTPAGHGIVGNYWFDRKSGSEVKSVKGPDPRHPEKQITGPVQLTTTTFGDELVLAKNQKSRVFSVSGKDRGAILPGGYMGHAFWYSWDDGTFGTSEYYYEKDKQPAWLTEWNNKKLADSYQGKGWTLFNPDKSSYVFGNSDNRKEENIYCGNTKNTPTFPHDFKGLQGSDLYKRIYISPILDKITLDLAKCILKNEKLGQGKYPDMLAVSFSATDSIGHTWGPYSLEYEDNLLHLDATLADLIQSIDETVGLDNTLIVLTSDHGVDMMPEFRKNLKMPGGRFDVNNFGKVINKALKEKFNIDEDLTVGFRNPTVYLNEKRIAELKLDLYEVEKVAARAAMTLDGVTLAVSRTDILKGNVLEHQMAQYLTPAFHPRKSGNIFILQEPFWFLYHVFDKDSSMHGSPYSYDNHVPIFFAGPGIEPETVYRRVTPLDIADTVAQLLGTPSPPRSTGHPLLEVLK